jgi:hypothetical protein
MSKYLQATIGAGGRAGRPRHPAQHLACPGRQVRSLPCGLSRGARHAALPPATPRSGLRCLNRRRKRAPERAARAGGCVARPSGNKHVVTKRAERCRDGDRSRRSREGHCGLGQRRSLRRTRQRRSRTVDPHPCQAPRVAAMLSRTHKRLQLKLRSRTLAVSPLTGVLDQAPLFSAVHKQYQGFTIAPPAAVKPREGRP